MSTLTAGDEFEPLEHEKNDAEKPPTMYEMRNSDRRTCSSSRTSNSNQWSTTGEQQRYRESGRNHYGANTNSSVSTWDASLVGGKGGSSVDHTNIAVVVTADTNEDNDDHTATVSITDADSTISAFEIISLNGTSSQRACQVCTLLNRYESRFCEACDASLHHNPCPDADTTLAQELQDEENKYEFSMVQLKETTPKHTGLFIKQPLIVQSREFKKDVFHFVNAFKNRTTVSSLLENDTIGYNVVPEVSMVILASRFIETLISNHRKGKNADVLIRYCVTPKLDGLFHEKIKENAFPPNSTFSLYFELALQHPCEKYDTRTLGVIPENVTVAPVVAKLSKYTSSASLSENLGWIAAIVKGDDTTDVWDESDKCYTTVPNPSQTLPLLCFDASLWKSPATDYLFQGMIRVCNDFFDTMKEQVDEDMMRTNLQYTCSERKKAWMKANTTASDYDVETTTRQAPFNHKNDDIDANHMVDNNASCQYEDHNDDDAAVTGTNTCAK